jgi:signal transduction histidine kinase
MMVVMNREPTLWPVERQGVLDRLRLTLQVSGAFALAPVAIVLGVLTVVGWATAVVLVGGVVLLGVVPASRLLVDAHRKLAGDYLDEAIEPWYRSTTGGPIARLWTWLRDPARWRDFGFLWYSATGGFVLAGLPVLLLAASPTYLLMPVIMGGWQWIFFWGLVPVSLGLWWLLTPPLVRARFVADRRILAHDRTEELERRVEEVTATRAETLDHSDAELRRIERDLHDGAQARIVSLGMNLGLAEQLLETDPAAAAALLAEARGTTVSALDDLRSVVRGIHPPVLADRGLAGAVEALALQSLPVSIFANLPGRPPAPVESAAYFAVAECLANVVKHAGARMATLRLSHDGRALHVTVVDDGRGGASLDNGTGLSGVARRLAAFDGTMVVSSPDGGPTEVRVEVPCALS